MDLNETATKCTTEVHDIHLQDIERPEYMGKRVRIPVIVAGVGKTDSIPATVTIRCTGDGSEEAPCFETQVSIEIAREPEL